jgi:hypothetical protein
MDNSCKMECDCHGRNASCGKKGFNRLCCLQSVEGKKTARSTVFNWVRNLNSDKKNCTESMSGTTHS